MSTLRSVAINLGSLSAAEVVTRLGGLVLTVFLAQYLGTENFGVYSFCIAFAGMFGVVARLGVRQIVLREIVRAPEESSRYLSTAFASQFFQAGLAILVIFAAAKILGYSGIKLQGILIMAVAMALQAFISLFFAVFEARGRMDIEAALLVAKQALWSVLAVLLMWAGRPYPWFLAALCATAGVIAVAAGIITWRRFHAYGPRIDARTLSALMKAGLPLAFAAVLVDIYMRVDMVMIERLLSDLEVGQYAASYRLIQALIALSGSFLTVVYPLFSRLRFEDEDRLATAYYRALKSLSLLLVPICAGTSALAPAIMSAIYRRPEFNPGADALAVAVWAVCFQSLSAVMGRLLVASNRQIVILYVSGASVLTNLLLNWILIPRFGIVGAASASVATMCGVLILNALALRRHLPGLPRPFGLWRVFAAGLLMGVAVHAISSLPLWITIPAGAVIYFVLIRALRVIDSEDRRLLGAALRRGGPGETE